LSASAFSAFGQAIRAACFRAGVEVIAVNPAWTSVIGSVNYAARFGLSVHLAAAVAIARRGLSFRETPGGVGCCNTDPRRPCHRRPCHLPATGAESQEACVVVLGGSLVCKEGGAGKRISCGES
jgi:hypothetical protein